MIRPPKILILESHLIIAADVSLQLSKLGYEVIGIHTRSKGALKIIGSHRPDIVLMNLKMQGNENRLTTARIISKNFRIPVVLLSAHTDRELLKQLIHNQPYPFITKPFDVESLQRGLKTALERMNVENFGQINAKYDLRAMPTCVPSGSIIKPFGK